MSELQAFIGVPGPMEMVIIGIIAVLLFGSRLPKVARSVGSSVIEFKRGLKGIKDETADVAAACREEPGE